MALSQAGNKSLPEPMLMTVDDSSLLWKGQENIYTFEFNDIERADL